MCLNRDFWTGKKVLVTGHTGFVGSWLTYWLYQKGANLSGFALSPKATPNLYSLLKISEKVNSHIGDIRDYGAIKSFADQVQPDIIIHLAAQPLVRESYVNPLETYATNVMGTVHSLEVNRQLQSARVFLNVTTDKCYENVEQQEGYLESSRLGGKDPYSSSKACSELITYAYRQSYVQENKAIATARSGNIIGGGDWSNDRLIPDLFRAYEKSSVAKIRYPDSIRPWLYVLDSIYGYLKLVEALWNNPENFCGAWNFGPDEDNFTSVRQVADLLYQFWPGASPWVTTTSNTFQEAKILKLNNNKAKKHLHWSPVYDIFSTMEATAQWYSSYLSGRDIEEYTSMEICKYEAKTQLLMGSI